MKKLLSLLLALCLTVSLFACATSPDPAGESTLPPTSGTTHPDPPDETVITTPTSEPETTEATVAEVIHDVPMAAISITGETEITNGQEGTTVFEYTYQNIRLLLPDPEMAMTVNLDLLNRIDATRTAATDLMNDAVAAEPQYPYSLSIVYEPMRLDSSVLSLFGQQTTYNGGGHANSTGHGLTYDLTTGSVLTLADVLASGVTADTLCPLVINALAALPEEYYLYADYSVTVEERFSGDFLADDSWHLSGEGLCFTFAPYEVAPYSTGFVHAVIPYELLTGVLDDVWFPPEQVTPDGVLEVLPFSQEDTEQFDQFAELYLDREGSSCLLHSTGLVYDVVIESGFWNAEGTVFTPERTVFMAGSLVASDAVMIQTDIPDTLPDLRITYTAAEGTVTVYLSASGEDSTPLLISN